MSKDDFLASANPNVLFDLRQTYAMQIITPILLELECYRSESNFIKWFETLTDKLYVNVHQKLDDLERKDYKDKLNITIEALHNNPTVYKGTNKDPILRYKLKEALKDLEMWLKDKMEDKGLYGKGSEYDWDEI